MFLWEVTPDVLTAVPCCGSLQNVLVTHSPTWHVQNLTKLFCVTTLALHMWHLRWERLTFAASDFEPSDVYLNIRWSTQWPLYSPFWFSMWQNFPHEGNWKLCVIFSYLHMRNEECSCWQWPGLAAVNTFFQFTWLCVDGWSNCLPFCFSYSRSPCDGYNPSQFYCLMALSPPLHKLLSAGASWMFINMPMSLLSHRSSTTTSALVLLQMSLHFSRIVLCARSCDMPLLFGLTVPQR